MGKEIIKKIKFVITLTGLIIIFKIPVFAQTNFYLDKTQYSQAFAGYNNTELSFGTSYSFLGIDEAPAYHYINFTHSINEKLGSAFKINNFNTGNFSNISASGYFAYQTKLNQKSKLSFGINPAIFYSDYNFSKVKGVQSDPVLIQIADFNRAYFNIGAGFVFQHNNFFIAGSVPFLLTNYGDEFNVYSLNHSSLKYNLNVIYYKLINQNIKLETNLGTYYQNKKYTQNLNFSANILFHFKEQLITGLSYKSYKTPGIMIGGAISNKFIFMYSYSISLGEIALNNIGNHQISLSLLIKRSNKNEITDLFPRNIQEKIDLKKNEEIIKLKDDINTLKITLNKIISEYDTKIEQIENAEKVNNLVVDWSAETELETIEFNHLSDEIYPHSETDLNRILLYLFENPEKLVKINIYSENIEAEKFSKELSEKRAKKIKQFLSDNGIPKNRILFSTKVSKDKQRITIQYSE